MVRTQWLVTGQLHGPHTACLSMQAVLRCIQVGEEVGLTCGAVNSFIVVLISLILLAAKLLRGLR